MPTRSRSNSRSRSHSSSSHHQYRHRREADHYPRPPRRGMAEESGSGGGWEQRVHAWDPIADDHHYAEGGDQYSRGQQQPAAAAPSYGNVPTRDFRLRTASSSAGGGSGGGGRWNNNASAGWEFGRSQQQQQQGRRHNNREVDEDFTLPPRHSTTSAPSTSFDHRFERGTAGTTPPRYRSRGAGAGGGGRGAPRGRGRSGGRGRVSGSDGGGGGGADDLSWFEENLTHPNNNHRPPPPFEDRTNIIITSESLLPLPPSSSTTTALPLDVPLLPTVLELPDSAVVIRGLHACVRHGHLVSIFQQLMGVVPLESSRKQRILVMSSSSGSSNVEQVGKVSNEETADGEPPLVVPTLSPPPGLQQRTEGPTKDSVGSSEELQQRAKDDDNFFNRVLLPLAPSATTGGDSVKCSVDGTTSKGAPPPPLPSLGSPIPSSSTSTGLPQGLILAQDEALVLFRTAEHAMTACSKLHGGSINGQIVSVTRS